LLVPCAQAGCGNNVPKGTKFCERHRGRSANPLAENPVASLYNSPAWRKTSHLVRSHNSLCQRLINGKQCTEPSRLVHHRLSPYRRRDLFLSIYDENGVSQLIALCQSHHPDVDTPDWREGVDFTRTEFRITI
jgi:hypothetical protein